MSCVDLFHPSESHGQDTYRNPSFHWLSILNYDSFLHFEIWTLLKIWIYTRIQYLK